jgi:hypothetical protein
VILVLQVMGAPLAGMGPRVSVVTGGGLVWSSGWPRPRSARVLLAFPLKGSERKGLALVEAKRMQVGDALICAQEGLRRS